MVRGGLPAEVAAEASAATVTGESAAATAGEFEPEWDALLAEFADTEGVATFAAEPDASVDTGNDADPVVERDAQQDTHADVDAEADAESTGNTETGKHADDVTSTDGDTSTDNARTSSVVHAPVVSPMGPAQIPSTARPMVATLGSASVTEPVRPLVPTVSPSAGSNLPFAAAGLSTVMADAAQLPSTPMARSGDPASLLMTAEPRLEAAAAKASSPAGAATAGISATTAAASAGVDTTSSATFVPSVQAEAVADVRGLDDLRPLSGLLESMESPSTMLRLEAPVSAGRAPSLALPLALAGGPLPTMALAVDSGDGQWLQGMAQDIVQLQEAGESRLRINLAPAHLGSLQVELQQTDLGMELRVLADSASARDLLQAHSADLRQRFAEAGMHLAQFHCGTGSQSQNSGHSGSTAVHGASTGDGAGDDIPTPPVMRPLAALRLLDLYA